MSMKSAVSSLYQAIDLDQDIKPLLIGERANANGSKKFRELLVAEDYQGCLRIGLEQQAKGAQVLDLCVAYAGRDETKDMVTLVKMFAESVKCPLMIDSTTPAVIEETLKLYPGRCIINSINLEDGGTNLHRICRLAKRYGAAVVALTINEKGMAMTCAEKVETAKQIYDLAVHQHGLRAHDILFDMLTFTIGSGDETLRDAAIQTLDAIKQIKQDLPGVFTVLGLSNISFGLRPAARRVLNSVFLHEAVQIGLDAAIVDTAKVIPFAQIDEAQREISLDLIYDRQKNPDKSPLMAFIDYFESLSGQDSNEQQEQTYSLAETELSQKIIRGDKDGLEDMLTILLDRYRPLDIINDILVPSMRVVGELFGRGDMLLPFVLQSAEAMKQSVAFLEPFMEKIDQNDATKVLLATVQGDVHDIGKNLVDIILSNNGYKVYNIGIKKPAETIIEKAREYQVDIIGLSGLLVKSALVMQESMPQYLEAGLKTPILLGGAALTPKFVAESCVPGYDAAPVVYCADAFAGLKAVQSFEDGTLQATSWQARPQKVVQAPGATNEDIRRDNPVPDVPFLGARTVDDIDPTLLFKYVNEQALFRGRWGYRRGKMSAEEYQDLMEGTVLPLYEELKTGSIASKLIRPRASYGYFRCYSEGETVKIETEQGLLDMTFPRQAIPPHLCITDYFKTKAEGGDIVGFFVVTIGSAISQEVARLYQANDYHDYLMLHGFSVEVTDALAEVWHEVMRAEMGFRGHEPSDMSGYVTQQYQGSRYGFGYPACPDLGAHQTVWQLLDPGKIGVTLTENMEMVPEQTTSAIVVHHPQAKYFSV